MVYPTRIATYDYAYSKCTAAQETVADKDIQWDTVLQEVLTMARKRQVSFIIDEEIAQEYEQLRKETGLPVSRLIELKLNGYSVVKEVVGDNRMMLIEVTNGSMGESYVRVQVIAETVERAVKIAKNAYLKDNSNCDNLDCTVLCEDTSIEWNSEPSDS